MTFTGFIVRAIASLNIAACVAGLAAWLAANCDLSEGVVAAVWKTMMIVGFGFAVQMQVLLSRQTS